MPIERLPTRVQPAAYRLRAIIMSDATLLAVIGIMGVVRGISYLDDPLFTHPAELWLSLHVWAIIWIISGTLCLVAAVFYRSTFSAVMIGLLVGLYILWGCSFALQSLADGAALWASATHYWGIATVTTWAVWRGSRMQIREVYGE